MDLEKSMQFVLEQQAQFWATLQKLGEAHMVLEADQKRLAADQKRLAENQLELARMQSQQQEMIGGVVMAVGELVQAQKRTEQRVQELAEAQQRTDQNLNALIKVVDDVIRRGRDGRRR